MSTSELLKYDQAKRLIAEAKTKDEVIEIHDLAVAREAYARQVDDKETRADMAVIRLRARRRLGQIMKQQKASVGFSKGGRPSKDKSKRGLSTLAEAGIKRSVAAQARKACAPSDEEFEKICDEAHAGVMAVEREADRKLDKVASERMATQEAEVVTVDADPVAPQEPADAFRAAWGALGAEESMELMGELVSSPVPYMAVLWERADNKQQTEFLRRYVPGASVLRPGAPPAIKEAEQAIRMVSIEVRAELVGMLCAFDATAIKVLWDKLPERYRREFCEERGLSRPDAVAVGVPQVISPGTDTFGRPRLVAGSMLKERGPSGKNGRVRDRD